MAVRMLLLSAWAGVVGATAAGDKVSMVWMANPYPRGNITVDTMISALAENRDSFTALGYQYFAICGEGSNQPGGSNDCEDSDAVGMPKLRKGHPILVPEDIGARFLAGLGKDIRGKAVELWPVISYGNPGNATVVNNLIRSPAATDRFIADAIQIAHAQHLSGFNFDIEVQGIDMTALASFMNAFVHAMHAAVPRIGVSYDAGNTPLPNVVGMDRWISMATYTSDLNGYLSGLAQGVNASGSAFGVGMCPICTTLGAQGAADRFDAINTYGGVVREIDMWAGPQVPAESREAQWQGFWSQMAKWLAAP